MSAATKRLPKCYTCPRRVDPQSTNAALCASALCRGLLCKSCFDASPLNSCSPDCYSDTPSFIQPLYGNHARPVRQTTLTEYQATRVATGVTVGFE